MGDEHNQLLYTLFMSISITRKNDVNPSRGEVKNVFAVPGKRWLR
jgi:hypothetical protein